MDDGRDFDPYDGEGIDRLIELQDEVQHLREALAASEFNLAEHVRLKHDLNRALHPNGDGPPEPAFCDVVAYVEALVARAADAERRLGVAERERDEYREGFQATDEMYKAAVAIFKEQRRVLGVPEGDGVSITDHCTDLVRRLGVAREALKNADTMLRAARTRLVASGATMDVYDATLAETKEALAALGPAPTPTTPTH